MVGITLVSNNAIPLNGVSTGVVNINAGAEAQAAKTEEDPLKLSFSGAAASNKSEANESVESGEPEHIQQLRKMIERLRKQLEQQQKQLQEIMSSNMEATAKASAVAAAQSAVSATMSALMTANAQLVKALLDAGGGGAGSMVSTTA
ncbi:hypothetical protein [Pseudomonas sp. DG56-2]|uniref:hypothetical protein n=1 Tax=Pseudomonas sp. DG56-2 TaxID=2320270 RepID=UPI0010A5B6FE|nr:hypothetical protein [Pseudomonas sp. DG56-2]